MRTSLVEGVTGVAALNSGTYSPPYLWFETGLLVECQEMLARPFFAPQDVSK